MSLKIYINNETQDFLKRGNNDILSDIQISTTYALLQISGAFYSGSNTSATSVKLKKIQLSNPFNDVEEVVLSSSVITYSGGQFKIDPDVSLGISMDECVYYLEFENGENVYKSEAFLVQVFQQQLLASQTFWLASSTNELASQTNITI